MPQDIFKPFTMAGVDAATIGLAYTLVNSFNEPVVRLHIINASDMNLFVSFDGINDHDMVLPHDDITIIPQQSAAPNNKLAQFSRNVAVYCTTKGATGFVFVAGYHV